MTKRNIDLKNIKSDEDKYFSSEKIAKSTQTPLRVKELFEIDEIEEAHWDEETREWLATHSPEARKRMGTKQDLWLPRNESKSEIVRAPTTIQAKPFEQPKKLSTPYTKTGDSFSYSVNVAPKFAFECDGIDFWGCAHSKLDEIYFTSKDLIICCNGLTFTSKPFIKVSPSWLQLEDEHNATPQQLVLDWKDYSPPPATAKIDFWTKIMGRALENGVERIICCCGAGQGRTGTALASFALASGFIDDPDDAISFVRKQYSDKAIESKSQELYLWKLITE